MSITSYISMQDNQQSINSRDDLVRKFSSKHGVKGNTLCWLCLGLLEHFISNITRNFMLSNFCFSCKTTHSSVTVCTSLQLVGIMLSFGSMDTSTQGHCSKMRFFCVLLTIVTDPPVLFSIKKRSWFSSKRWAISLLVDSTKKIKTEKCSIKAGVILGD